MKLATIVTLVNLILDKFKRKKQYNTHNLIFFAKKAVAILGEFRYNQINF